MKSKTSTQQLTLFIIAQLLFQIVYSQQFNYSGGSVALNGASLNNTNCTSNRSIPITVAGVGPLSASNQLLEIDLTITSNTRLTVAMYLKDPSGNCYQISNRLGDPAHFGQTGRTLEYKFRAPTPCLNKQPDYTPISTPQHHYQAGIDSRFGVFSTISNISTVLNGINANGTWTLYFSCTNTTYCAASLPTVTAAALTFGSPISVAAPDPAAGVSCVNAIDWDGEPLCATTAGKTNTTNRPGVTGCAWLSTSENNLWIAFTPNQTNVCINISGIQYISGTASGVQSIIVESATPCSGAWTVVNCPRDNVYASNVGSILSHNHCFSATVGQTYYLVIDGNAGAVTELYITGINGLPIILPVELNFFQAICENDHVNLSWSTANELNNDYFTVEKSYDGISWAINGHIYGNGTTSSASNYRYVDVQEENEELVYYRLSQTDFDGTKRQLTTIPVSCGGKSVKVIPNPNEGEFLVTNLKRNDIIKLVDLQGRTVYQSQSDNEGSMNFKLDFLPVGIYMLSIENQFNECEIQRIHIH
jgi:hypothetical protein